MYRYTSFFSLSSFFLFSFFLPLFSIFLAGLMRGGGGARALWPPDPPLILWVQTAAQSVMAAPQVSSLASTWPDHHQTIASRVLITRSQCRLRYRPVECYEGCHTVQPCQLSVINGPIRNGSIHIFQGNQISRPNAKPFWHTRDAQTNRHSQHSKVPEATHSASPDSVLMTTGSSCVKESSAESGNICGCKTASRRH